MLDVIRENEVQGYLAHKNPFPLRLYSSAVPRGLGGSRGGERFLLAPVVLQSATASCHQLLPQLDGSRRSFISSPRWTPDVYGPIS